MLRALQQVRIGRSLPASFSHIHKHCCFYHGNTSSSRVHATRPRKTTQQQPPAAAQLEATHTYFVTCHPGLEQALADELAQPLIGAQDIVPGKSGVHFSGHDLEVGYRANLWVRCGVRVLLLVARQDLDLEERARASGDPRSSGDAVYEFAKAATRWEDLLPRGGTFSVDARLHSAPGLTHSGLAAMRVKDAICDRLRDTGRGKPEPPGPQMADLPLVVTVFGDTCSLYRDMSATSLHKRGYRQGPIHKAALSEAAAAGILRLAGWHQHCEDADSGTVLTDPMCGSGTLLVEGLLVACNVAPGLQRQRWPFQRWPDFERRKWQRVVEEARAAARPWRGRAMGCDISEAALSLADSSAEAAGVRQYLHLAAADCASWNPPARPSFVATNPPWGVRLMQGAPAREERRGREGRYHDDGRSGRGGGEVAGELQEAWAGLGAFLRAHCGETDAYVLCGNRQASAALRLRASNKWPLTLGDVDARLLHYRMLPSLEGRPPQATRQPVAADSG